MLLFFENIDRSYWNIFCSRLEKAMLLFRHNLLIKIKKQEYCCKMRVIFLLLHFLEEAIHLYYFLKRNLQLINGINLNINLFSIFRIILI